MPGIFSIEVEGQRARNHEPLSEAIHFRRTWGGIPEVIADVSNPFSYDPKTISSLRYFGNVEVCGRSEPLEWWVKC